MVSEVDSLELRKRLVDELVGGTLHRLDRTAVVAGVNAALRESSRDQLLAIAGDYDLVRDPDEEDS